MKKRERIGEEKDGIAEARKKKKKMKMKNERTYYVRMYPSFQSC